MKIEKGQWYTGKNNGILFQVIGVTEKSVRIEYEVKYYWMDYPQRRRNTISKQQFINTMEAI